MGFDVAGLNPKIRKSEEEYSVYGDKTINIFNDDVFGKFLIVFLSIFGILFFSRY